MKRLIPLAIIVMVGCKSPIFGERFRKYIGPGMSTVEVKNVLGNPDGYEQNGELELYTYTDKMVSGWGWDKGNYQILFRNDKVIQYGIGSMRFREWVPAPSNNLNITIRQK